jgi:hypothetical protein
MPRDAEKSAGVRTYDQAANKLAKSIAATRSASPERIARLSELVRRSADSLAAKVIDCVKRQKA